MIELWCGGLPWHQRLRHPPSWLARGNNQLSTALELWLRFSHLDQYSGLVDIFYSALFGPVFLRSALFPIITPQRAILSVIIFSGIHRACLPWKINRIQSPSEMDCNPKGSANEIALCLIVVEVWY